MRNTFITRLVLLIGICIINCQSPTSKKSAQSDELISQFQQKMEAKEYPEAIRLIDKAITLEREAGDTSRLINTLFMKTRCLAFSGNFNEVIKTGQEGTSLCQSISDVENEYKFNNFLSWAYFETQQDFERIMGHVRRQIELVDLLENDEYKAGVYNNYGYDGTVAGTIPLDDLLKYQHFANDFYAKENGHKGLWYTLMNLTWIYRLQGDLGNSEKYGKLSVAQALADNDWHAISEANTNLAETYLEIGRIDLAEQLYNEAINWSGEKPERDQHVFNVYYGKYLWNYKQDKMAISLLEDAIEFLESGEVFYEMMGRLHLAQICIHQGRLEDARTQLSKIKNPRHDFISFEVRTLAEKLADKVGMANDISSFLSKADQIGAQLIVEKLNQE